MFLLARHFVPDSGPAFAVDQVAMAVKGIGGSSSQELQTDERDFAWEQALRNFWLGAGERRDVARINSEGTIETESAIFRITTDGMIFAKSKKQDRYCYFWKKW